MLRCHSNLLDESTDPVYPVRLVSFLIPGSSTVANIVTQGRMVAPTPNSNPDQSMINQWPIQPSCLLSRSAVLWQGRRGGEAHVTSVQGNPANLTPLKSSFFFCTGFYSEISQVIYTDILPQDASSEAYFAQEPRSSLDMCRGGAGRAWSGQQKSWRPVISSHIPQPSSTALTILNCLSRHPITLVICLWQFRNACAGMESTGLFQQAPMSSIVKLKARWQVWALDSNKLKLRQRMAKSFWWNNLQLISAHSRNTDVSNRFARKVHRQHVSCAGIISCPQMIFLFHVWRFWGVWTILSYFEPIWTILNFQQVEEHLDLVQRAVEIATRRHRQTGCLDSGGPGEALEKWKRLCHFGRDYS